MKALDFPQVLAHSERFAAQDPDLAQRWRILVKPKGREWLKTNLKRIQAVL